MIDDVIITPLKIINVPGGDVFHAMKKNDSGFAGFGEAYFSTIEPGIIKAWKRHQNMTLNLIVPHGKIRFIIFDDRATDTGKVQEIILSRDNYCRLTVPPMVWMGFQGVATENSMLLNIASLSHDPEESDKKEISEIIFDWSLER
ncbi:MAG: dTDP-4-dehydrorhamnose 3,5-epimerase [Gammaproteobacteria bacterium]|nr:dTDP-4-dehydrorhamnose 3,5-epimerase [Gammaproteobacteria bacterium]